MKKLFTILLCIAMMLSATACGNQQAAELPETNAYVPNQNAPASGDPSEEESWQISYYISAVEALDQLAASGDLDSLWFAYAHYGIEPKDGITDVWGTDALKEYYDLIRGLDAVDRWVGTDLTAGTDINWDRQEVLSNFHILENVKLGEKYTVYDPVGNITELEMKWSYQPDGTLAGIHWDSDIGERYQHAFVFNPMEIDPLHLMMLEGESGATLAYDETGKLTEVKITDGETKFLGVLCYGENGKVSSATVTSAYGEKGTLTYSYDQQNRLTEVDFSGNDLWGQVYYRNSYWDGYGEKDFYGSKKFTYTYTYNTDGTVAKKVYSGYDIWSGALNHSIVTAYSYDASGNLSGAVCQKDINILAAGSETRYTFTDTYDFSYDEMDNPVAATITCGDIVHNGEYTEPAEYAKIEITCVYGDLYSYDPAA